MKTTQQYIIATKTSRFLANAIDQFIIGLLMITVIGLPLGIIYHLYRDSFKFLNYQSIGKKAVGIRIIDFSNRKSPYITSIKRHWYTWVPLFAIIDGIYLIFNKNSQRFGDLIANTIVVIDFDGYEYDEFVNHPINNQEKFNFKESTNKLKINFKNIFSNLASFIKKKYKKYKTIIFIIFTLSFLIVFFLIRDEQQTSRENAKRYELRMKKLEVRNFLVNNMFLLNNNIIIDSDDSRYILNNNLTLHFDFDYYDWKYDGTPNDQALLSFTALKNTENDIKCKIVTKTLDGIEIESKQYRINEIYPTQTTNIGIPFKFTRDNYDKLIDIHIITNDFERSYWNLKPYDDYEYSNCNDECQSYFEELIKYYK